MSKSYAKTWSVKSSNGHRSYTVAQNYDGTYECSCKGWTRHRSECRHIKEIKLGIRRVEAVEAKKAEIKSRLGLEGENKLLFVLKYDNQVPSRPEPEKVVDKRTPLEKIRDNASWRLAA